jgi:putative transposase
MDGHGRWMENVFIERLWRSLKYECGFLNGFEIGNGARTGGGMLDRLTQRRWTRLGLWRRTPGETDVCYAIK